MSLVGGKSTLEPVLDEIMSERGVAVEDHLLEFLLSALPPTSLLFSYVAVLSVVVGSLVGGTQSGVQLVDVAAHSRGS